MTSRPQLHVVIASGQNQGNLIPALQCGATQAWVLQTPAMKASAEQLTQAFKARGIEVKRIPFDDRDVATLMTQAQDLAAQLDGKPVVINFTGGTKPMALALNQQLAGLLNTGSAATAPHLVYCDTDHQRLEWLSPAPQSEPMQDVLQLNDILLAQGYRRQSGNGGAAAAEQDRAAQERADLTRWLGLNVTKLGNFLGAMNYLASRARPDEQRFEARQQFNYPPGGKWVVEWLQRCAELGLAHWDGEAEIVFADAAAAVYLGGGWVEEFAALKLKGLFPHRWEQNLQVEQVGSGTRNELDAVVVHRNRMLIIECKAARTDNTPADWIYKLSQLSRSVGGALATPLLLSARKLDPEARQRAAQYKVDVIDGAEIQNLVPFLQRWKDA